MMKLQKYNQLFEADIKKNKGVPEDYIEGVEQKGREKYGYNGPSREEIHQIMDITKRIGDIQRGHEDELTEIGKEIIMQQYGSILDDVKLDIKVVRPDDEEKMEMVQKMINDEDDEPKIPSNDVEIPEEPVDQDEVDKRKILNNIMQGESQNVHSLMHYGKDKIDEIDGDLLDLYNRFLDLTKKADWDDRLNLEMMMKQMPQFCNAEEVNWEENEDGETTPVIKVRAIDLPLMIHETLKGIYELIMANAIPEDKELARKIMAETDSLSNEKEDVKFGPFIAADLRDFITSHLERTSDTDINEIPNLKEFIYGRIVELPANIFIELMYAILSGDQDKADTILRGSDHPKGYTPKSGKEARELEEKDLIYQAINDATGTVDVGTIGVDIPDDEGDTVVGKIEDDEILKPKEKSYSDMSKSELDRELNQALEVDDYETIKKIQPYL